MGTCDLGCQPDWHKDGCAIYLPAPTPKPDAAAGTGLGLSEVLASQERSELLLFDGAALIEYVERIVAARVAEAKASAWDEAHRVSCDMAGNCWGGGCPLHENPYRADRLALDASSEQT